MIQEANSIEEAIKPPSNLLEDTVRTYQLKILELLYKKDYQAVLDIVKKDLSALPEETWHLFLENNSLKGKQWTNLTFEQAAEIAEPFNGALNQETIIKGFKVGHKKYFDKPGGAMLLELVLQDLNSKTKEKINNFVTTLACYTSDVLLFNLMKTYFSEKVDSSKYKPLSVRDIEDLSKLLEKTELSGQKVKEAQEKQQWAEEEID